MSRQLIIQLLIITPLIALSCRTQKEQLIVQHTEPESILSAPENWQSERIDFPLGFARTINFTGFEELRFAPGWSDSTSQEFWTYTFVWYIDNDTSLTAASLATTMDMYFDGLMGVAEDATDSSPVSKTRSLFHDKPGGYEGRIMVHDAFFTKENMTLYVKVREDTCTQAGKRLYSLELSPQSFEAAVWSIFEEVELTISCD